MLLGFFKRYIAPIFGLILLASLLLYYDFKLIYEALASAQIFWVVVSAVFLILSTLLGAINLFLLFRPEDRPIGFKTFLLIYWFGWAVGLVVPGQVGDVASNAVLLKRRNVKVENALGFLIIDKFVSLFTMCCFACYGIYAIRDASFFGFNLLGNKLAILFAFILLLIGVIVFILKSSFAKRRGLDQVLLGTLKKIYRTCIDYPVIVLRNFLITVIKIICVGFAYITSFYAFGVQDIDILLTTALAITSGLVAYLPISFNGLGTVELTGIVLFGLLGITEHIILSSYLLLRFMGLVLAWLPMIVLFPQLKARS